MVTDSLVKKKFVHETLQAGILKIYSTQEMWCAIITSAVPADCSPRFPLTRLIARYQARTAPSSCASFLISVFWICSTGSATTASVSSSAETSLSITAWSGACCITKHSLSFAMASTTKYGTAYARNWKIHSTHKNHKLWQTNI